MLLCCLAKVKFNRKVRKDFRKVRKVLICCLSIIFKDMNNCDIFIMIINCREHLVLNLTQGSQGFSQSSQSNFFVRNSPLGLRAKNKTPDTRALLRTDRRFVYQKNKTPVISRSFNHQSKNEPFTRLFAFKFQVISFRLSVST